ncbi:MAG: acyl-CoA desaturase [Rhizobiales bacterium]|nr:acyl-CoA desaturase [Hyphomicrobiales bacterium]
MSVAAYHEVDAAAPEAHPSLPTGVIIGGPLVRAKRVESAVLFATLISGSIVGLAWAFTQGLGWVEWSLFAIMYALTTLGIGAGVHRMLVHRSFRCDTPVKFFFCAIGQMACQGSLLKWVGNHRRHHLYADHVGDPHSPYVDGKGVAITGKLKRWLHAQSRWVFDDTMTDNSVYAKDMLSDPMVMFFTRTRWFWYFLSMVGIPAAWGYAFGGVHAMWGTVLFAGFFRAYLVVMTSVAVGSVCHQLGYRRFDETKDESTNQLVMTIVTFGEGLHNNHHRFPRDAYISHAWYEFDLNGLIIRGLEKLGLVYDVVDASKHHVNRTEGSRSAEA